MNKIAGFLKNPKVITVYMIITLAFVGYYIANHWYYVPQILSSAHPHYILYAFLAGCINLLGFAFVYHVLYTDLGAKVSFWKTLQIILISRIGIYLPGRIWYASNLYIFSRKFDISPSVIAQSFGLSNIFLFMTGGIVSLPVVLRILPQWGFALLSGIILLIFVVMHPRSLKYILSLIPRLENAMKDQSYFTDFSSQRYLKFVVYFFLLWLIAALRLYYCVLIATPVSFDGFTIILAATSASLILGMIAVFAPGGIGVREGVGVFVLSAIMPLETAAFVMIVSRLLSAITELGAGAGAYYLLNRGNDESRQVQKSSSY